MGNGQQHRQASWWRKRVGGYVEISQYTPTIEYLTARNDLLRREAMWA